MKKYASAVALIEQTAVVILLWVTMAPGMLYANLNPVEFERTPDHAPVVLVRDGAAVAEIVVLSREPSRQLRGAVGELIDCIETISGARLELVEGPPREIATIIIGNGIQAAEAGLDGDEMPVEGFSIATAPNCVFIVGNDGVVDAASGTRSEGTAWGVYEFCERFLNVRWYYPTDRGGRSHPRRRTIAVDPVRLKDAPVFRFRHIWPSVENPYDGTGQDLRQLHATLRSHNSWPIQLRVHTPHWEKEEYTKTRLEIYQLKSDGRRDFSMLCYGDPVTLDTYLERLDEELRGGRKAGFIKGKAITVSPNDAEISCYCDHCRRLWDDGGGQYGTASRIVAGFVEKLATAVGERWPDMTILYLPYLNYTRAPDGIRFPGNVEVQLCGMPGLAQYKEPAIDREEQANIDAWIEVSGRRIQNWHYACWPEDRTAAVYLFPHVIQRHYRKNRHNMVGSFINGVTDHWPRQHLSLYCWMKVLWNPDFDVDAAIDEYCRRLYGPAAGTMRQLVRLQTDGWEKSRWPGGCLSAKGIYEESYPREDVVRMETLLTQARKEAADDAQTLRRIAYYALPFADFFTASKNYAEGTGFQPLLVQKAGENPRIDGRLDDAVWQRARANTFVRAKDREQKKCTYPTTLQAVWTTAGVTGWRMPPCGARPDD